MQTYMMSLCYSKGEFLPQKLGLTIYDRLYQYTGLSILVFR